MKSIKTTYNIAVLTGTRADYGILRPILYEIKKHSQLTLQLYAGNMHLLKKFGYTINEIKKDGFSIKKTVQMAMAKDIKGNMAISVSRGIKILTSFLLRDKPNAVLILGDRLEQLAMAISARYLNIPILHIHAGDESGAIDDDVRNSISSLSTVLFAATRKAKQRLSKMFGKKKQIIYSGSPAIDAIKSVKVTSLKTVNDNYSIKLKVGCYIIAMFHPDTNHPELTSKTIKSIIKAIKKVSFPSIIIYPNSDETYSQIIKEVKKMNDENINVYSSFPYDVYLTLLKHCAVLIGNSSSGIIEASVFKTPVVNIGDRQKGRECGNNVIHSREDFQSIFKALQKALNNKIFLDRCKKTKNIYGQVNSKKIIIKNILKLVRNYKR